MGNRGCHSVLRPQPEQPFAFVDLPVDTQGYANRTLKRGLEPYQRTLPSMCWYKGIVVACEPLAMRAILLLLNVCFFHTHNARQT